MNNDDLLKFARAVKEEKYCKKYLIDTDTYPYSCDSHCPFNYGGKTYNCNYETAFIDGFNESCAIFERVRKAQLEIMVDEIKHGIKL